MCDQPEVFEIERSATIRANVEAHSQEEAERIFDTLSQQVSTFEVDLRDWRFNRIPWNIRDNIVEIYAEEG